MVRALQALGFEIVREAQHIAMRRRDADGTTTRLTMPNHRALKESTLRAICTQTGILRAEFLRAYEQA